MATINRSAIFGKLNPVAYRAVEAAYNFTRLRNNSYVELVHWIQQILQLQDSDLHRIIKHYDLDAARLAADITKSLDDLPRGTTSNVNFSAHIDEAIEHAWLKASLLFNESHIRTGYLIAGMLDNRDLASQLYQISDQFKKVKFENLVEEYDAIAGGSPEATMQAKDGVTVEPEKLHEFVKNKLPKFAWPKYIRIVEQLPKTETHRIVKHILKKEGVTADTWVASK